VPAAAWHAALPPSSSAVIARPAAAPFAGAPG
jgi:hypothetical protein